MTGDKIWFKAKTHGWGWGRPTAWQGWVAYGAYIVAVVAGVFAFPPARNVAMFLACTLGATLVLLLVCLLKGEKPAWRWGDR